MDTIFTIPKTLYEIANLVKDLFLKDVELNPFHICKSLLFLIKDYSPPRIESRDLVTDSDFIEKIYHFMKFACGAYGWALLNGYQGKNFFQSDHKAMLNHCGLKQEDIICCQWQSYIHDPAHYMVLDHKTKSIIISIRGSLSLTDIITDINGHYTKFMGGLTHHGILKAAKKKIEILLPFIKEEMGKHQDYQLILTGHSLGAGAAVLMAIILYEKMKIPLECYAFAPPPLLLSDKTDKSYIKIFVNRDDVVPRLSLGSIEDFKLRIINNDKPEYMRIPKLYLPGTVYYINNNKIAITTQDSFKEIIVSANMFLDHFPDQYETVLEKSKL